MHRSLNVLLVEDNKNDALLILRELLKQRYKPLHERVDTAEAMTAALERKDWGNILTDHSMPAFSSGAALETLRQKGPLLPIVPVGRTVAHAA